MIDKIDHINILSTAIEQTIDFYTTIFDMTSIAMPGAAGSGGVWLCDRNGNAIFHVQNCAPDYRERNFARIRQRLGSLTPDLSPEKQQGTGLIEHVALECDDYDGLMSRIKQQGLSYGTNDIPTASLRQIFVKDPNGIILELNFRQIEVASI